MAQNYRYHVFGLVRGNKNNIEEYVAEGVLGNKSITINKKSKLAREICTNLLEDSLDYLSFSFKPTCEKAVYEGCIYHTQKLSENEQMAFLRLVREYVKKYNK